MIKYTLICDKEHEFESWFGSSEEFDKLARRGLVECPACGSSKVAKGLMSPRVSGTRKSTDAEVPMANAQAGTGTQLMPKELVDKLREFKKHVEANAENVGERFPEEARKIHYGEAESRGIYGKASLEDAANLAEEGVSVLPIPDLPEEKN